jgi:histidinol-phosphate aminotransferase
MSYLRNNIAVMEGYVPGFQPPDEATWIKLNTNENPYPPSPRVQRAILDELGTDGDRLRKYPDAGSREFRRVAAELYGVDPCWVISANGSDELLNNLVRACAGEGEEVAYLHPSYSYYATLAEIQGARVKTFELDQSGRIADFPERYQGRLFFLTSPNAPLGLAFDNAYIAELARRCAGLLVVDEAYADFAEHNALELVRQCDNVVITRTLSKSYSLAGMRLGLAVARPEIVAALDKIRDHYHLDRLALVAASAALRDQGYLRATVAKICATRDRFAAELETLGFQVLPSSANYLFVVPQDHDGRRVYDTLYAGRILVRFFSDPTLAHGVRISIGSDAEMTQALQTLAAVYG